MSYKNILVAFDGSEASERALGYAQELVEHGLASKLIVLTVTDPSDTEDPTLEIAARMANVEVVSVPDADSSDIELLIISITESYKETVDIINRTGKPHKVIIQVASEFECGLIIMGSRGLGTLRGALGSVSHAVLRDADIPVFITK